MNKTNIEWCDFTFNPVVGCKHGCKYCYAKTMNNRYKFIDNWENPQFFQDRLLSKVPKIPKDRNKIVSKLFPNTSVVFVGSMCDLFGNWVKNEWITKIIAYTTLYPETQFMFLTKNPSKYSEFVFHKNCWLGTSIETNQQRKRIEILNEHSHQNKFVSVEPLLGNMQSIDFYKYSFIIVGAMTGTKPTIPTVEFAKSVNHLRIFYKDNILRHYPELSNQ